MCVVKMAILQLLAFCLATILVVEAGLKVDCGSPSGKPAVITYSGDAVAVIAFAADTKQCRFVEDTATATFKLTMAYKKTAGIDCLLEQTVPSRPSYGTIVETRLLHELVEGGEDEKYVIECVFSPIKTDVTLNVALKPKYNPPIFILKTSGIVSKSGFTVFITDSSNKGLKIVSESQIVKLRTSMTPKGGEKGYQPIQCTAESMDRTVKLLILSDGCGTGFPWRYDQGFQMNNFFGDSPNFRMFRIRKKEGVVFKCTFVVCPTTCNENSCYKKSRTRRRRDLHRRVRRSLGVKYNPLGLVSHEESTGVEAAHVTVEPEDAAPTLDKPTEAHMAPKEQHDMGYGKYASSEHAPEPTVDHKDEVPEHPTEQHNIGYGDYASSRKIDGTFEFVIGNDAPKSHDKLNAEHQADKYHSDAVHEPDSKVDHEVPQPEHLKEQHDMSYGKYASSEHAPEPTVDHKDEVPEHPTEKHNMGYGDYASSRKIDGTFEFVMGNDAPKSHDKLNAEHQADNYHSDAVHEPESKVDHQVPEHPKEQHDMGYGDYASSESISDHEVPQPEHPTIDDAVQQPEPITDHDVPTVDDAVHEPESIADHEETQPEDSNVDDHAYDSVHQPESIPDNEVPEPEDSFDDHAFPPADSEVPQPEFPTDDNAVSEPESIADHEVPQPELPSVDDHAFQPTEFEVPQEFPSVDENAFQPTDNAVSEPGDPPVDENAFHPSEQSVELSPNGEGNQELAKEYHPFWNTQYSPVSEAFDVEKNLKLSHDIGEPVTEEHFDEDIVGKWDSEETLVHTPIPEINGDDETISEHFAGDGFTELNADFPGTETTLDKEHETAKHDYKDLTEWHEPSLSTDEHKLKNDAAFPASEMKEPKPEWSDTENWWHGGENSFNDPGELITKTPDEFGHDEKIFHDELPTDDSHLAHIGKYEAVGSETS